MLYWILGAGGGLFLYFYVWPLRKSFFEMSDRASLFAKDGFFLRSEKRAVLENIDEGVLTLDSRGRISYMNARAASFLRIGLDDVLGKNYTEVIPLYAKELWKVIKDLLEETFETKERLYNSSTIGQKTYLELMTIPISGKGGCILIMQDRSNQQKVLDMGKDFIANASHELRTPVTIIRGFAETLKELPEVSEDMYESILEKIIRNCERMENLVKNLLVLADLENSTKAEVQECDLVILMEDICYSLLNLSPHVHIEQLYNEDSIVIWGEATLLELAFSNLIKNAIKYGPPENPEIKILIQSKEDSVYVAISDNGIGIPERDLEHIFDRFYTVDKAHSRKLGGAGLGLSIVKTIMEKHRAQISVTSEVGKGTTFHMVFPKE